MLKQYPMLRYVLQKAFWYLLTFVVAVAINFTLPRMGENNPVDIIMGKAAQGLSPEEAKLKKEGLLKAFGMAELDDQGNVVYEPEVDEKGQMKTIKVPKLDENGEKIELPRSSWGWGSSVTQLYALSQSEADEIRNLVMGTDRVWGSDQGILDTITSEAEAFFAGQKSAQEVAKLVQSKLTIYVNEQR